LYQVWCYRDRSFSKQTATWSIYNQLHDRTELTMVRLDANKENKMEKFEIEVEKEG